MQRRVWGRENICLLRRRDLLLSEVTSHAGNYGGEISSPPLFAVKLIYINKMKQKVFYLICVIIGLVFIISGLGKVVDTAKFGNLIVEYGLGWLQFLAPLIAIVEIAVGLFLILRIKPKILGLISACILLIFTTAFTYGHFKTGITDCGCFGTFNISTENVALVYARNIFLLVLSVFVWRRYPANSEEKEDGSKMTILLGVMLPAIFVAGLTFKIPAFSRSAQTDLLISRHIKETPLNSFFQTDPDRSYLVFFYTYSCPHCWNSLGNLIQFKNSATVDSIVLFSLVSEELSEDSALKSEFIQNLGGLESREIVNDAAVQAFITAVPTTFYVKNDTIRAVIKSTLPHPRVFSRRMENLIR